MQFFFTGSIRGGRANQPEFEYILEEAKKYGEVSSQHVAGSNLPTYGETALSGKEILQREKQRIENCDIVIAEVTTASLGVGYLISYATSLGKKVIALYNDQSTLKLSAIIKGDELVSIYTYQNRKEVESIFKSLFQ